MAASPAAQGFTMSAAGCARSRGLSRSLDGHEQHGSTETDGHDDGTEVRHSSLLVAGLRGGPDATQLPRGGSGGWARRYQFGIDDLDRYRDPADAADVGIRVLGPVGVDGAERLSPRDRAVLGALVVERESIVGADRLADALWGEAPPASWRKVVQSSIVRLRRALGPHAIETTSSGYRLSLGVDEVDAWAFEQLLDRANLLSTFGEADRAAHTLDRALELWRGEPLEDLEGWPPAAAEAVRLHELRRLGEERRAEMLLATAQHDRLMPVARSLVAAEPLRERRWELLALALYRSGRQAEALRVLADAAGYCGTNSASNRVRNFSSSSNTSWIRTRASRRRPPSRPSRAIVARTKASRRMTSTTPDGSSVVPRPSKHAVSA